MVEPVTLSIFLICSSIAACVGCVFSLGFGMVNIYLNWKASAATERQQDEYTLMKTKIMRVVEASSEQHAKVAYLLHMSRKEARQLTRVPCDMRNGQRCELHLSLQPIIFRCRIDEKTTFECQCKYSSDNNRFLIDFKTKEDQELFDLHVDYNLHRDKLEAEVKADLETLILPRGVDLGGAAVTEAAATKEVLGKLA